MVIVHHLENSRSQRILWLLEELGVDYDIKSYKRDPNTNLAPPELVAKCFQALENVSEWAAPVKSGRRTYDDHKTFEDLKAKVG